jgi:hypothetical protein
MGCHQKSKPIFDPHLSIGLSQRLFVSPSREAVYASSAEHLKAVLLEGMDLASVAL